MAKRNVTISIDEELLERIDKERGLVKRSPWIENRIRIGMKDK